MSLEPIRFGINQCLCAYSYLLLCMLQEYFIVDADHDRVMVCVNHDVKSSHLYVSDTSGTRYTLSLPNIVYISPQSVRGTNLPGMWVHVGSLLACLPTFFSVRLKIFYFLGSVARKALETLFTESAMRKREQYCICYNKFTTDIIHWSLNHTHGNWKLIWNTVGLCHWCLIYYLQLIASNIGKNCPYHIIANSYSINTITFV